MLNKYYYVVLIPPITVLSGRHLAFPVITHLFHGRLKGEKGVGLSVA